MRTRRIIKVGSLVCLGIVVWIAFFQWPRLALISDLRKSASITVDWPLRDEFDRSVEVEATMKKAFELEATTRPRFVQDLTDNLGLDYLRGVANAPPRLGLLLRDREGRFLAYYVVRSGRGAGRSPSMASLRRIASNGRRLSEAEMNKIYDSGKLRAKWPHPFRFDYVLPVTGR